MHSTKGQSRRASVMAIDATPDKTETSFGLATPCEILFISCFNACSVH